ncbi:hypothetical protein J6590_017667 [Homalodisca vitripennis]|nr:hypothetical protein J6590_017667 [Homalodisca vitripennis]
MLLSLEYSETKIEEENSCVSNVSTRCEQKNLDISCDDHVDVICLTLDCSFQLKIGIVYDPSKKRKKDEGQCSKTFSGIDFTERDHGHPIRRDLYSSLSYGESGQGVSQLRSFPLSQANDHIEILTRFWRFSADVLESSLTTCPSRGVLWVTGDNSRTKPWKAVRREPVVSAGRPSEALLSRRS